MPAGRPPNKRPCNVARPWLWVAAGAFPEQTPAWASTNPRLGGWLGKRGALQKVGDACTWPQVVPERAGPVLHLTT